MNCLRLAQCLSFLAASPAAGIFFAFWGLPLPMTNAVMLMYRLYMHYHFCPFLASVGLPLMGVRHIGELLRRMGG